MAFSFQGGSSIPRHPVGGQAPTAMAIHRWGVLQRRRLEVKG